MKIWKKIEQTIFTPILKFIKSIEENKKGQEQRIREQKAIYLQERRRENEKKSINEARKKLKEVARKKQEKMSATFRTFTEFQQIVGPAYKNFSAMKEEEREKIINRAEVLVLKDENFRKAYRKWIEKEEMDKKINIKERKKPQIILGETQEAEINNKIALRTIRRKKSNAANKNRVTYRI